MVRLDVETARRRRRVEAMKRRRLMWWARRFFGLAKDGSPQDEWGAKMRRYRHKCGVTLHLLRVLAALGIVGLYTVLMCYGRLPL